jgi:prolyl-tRNA synthetase
MKWSRLHIPTLRETPAEAETAHHRLLLRAGYVRPLGPGIFHCLLLASRSLRKIEAIIRDELDAIGAQEMRWSALQPVELLYDSGDDGFRMRDKSGRDLCLAVSFAETAAAIARGEIRSYKQLPQIWYRLQTVFCDDAGSKSSLLHTRESLRKDSYSFDIDERGRDASVALLRAAYRRVLSRCGLPFLEADGLRSHAFLVPAAGGDRLAAISKSGYAACHDMAAAQPSAPLIADPEGDLEPEMFHTPGQKTIADVSAFTGLPYSSQMKTLVMVADAGLKLLVLRGDHQLSEAKLKAVTGASKVWPANPYEIEHWLGALPGSLGPLGVMHMPVLADLALRGRRNMICGANRDDYHMRNVTPGEDFQPRWCDLRQVCEGEATLDTSEPLEMTPVIEVARAGGNPGSTGFKVLDENGKEAQVVMGSSSIAVERILYAAAEVFGDANGLCLPRAIAPFDVVITPVNIGDAALREAALRIYSECRTAGIDALLDDRDERPGVKFKDAELIGVPWRVTVGKKLAEGKVELVERRSRETREVEVDRVVEALKE